MLFTTRLKGSSTGSLERMLFILDSTVTLEIPSLRTVGGATCRCVGMYIQRQSADKLSGEIVSCAMEKRFSNKVLG